MGSVGNNTSTTNTLPVLRIENNRIKWDERDKHGLWTLHERLYGTIQYYAYEEPLRKLGTTKAGVEYGVVGTKRTTNSRYNFSNGHIGYKIDDGTVYITNFAPTTIAEASKWVREAVRDTDKSRWIPLGRLK